MRKFRVLQKLRVFSFLMIVLSLILGEGCNHEHCCMLPHPEALDNGFLLRLSNGKIIFMDPIGIYKYDEDGNGVAYQRKLLFDLSGTEPVLYKKFDFVGKFNLYEPLSSWKNWYIFYRLKPQSDWIGVNVRDTTSYLFNVATSASIRVTDVTYFPWGTYNVPVSFAVNGRYTIWEFHFSELCEKIEFSHLGTFESEITSSEYDKIALIYKNGEIEYGGVKGKRCYIGKFLFDAITGSYNFATPFTVVTLEEEPIIINYSGGFYFFVGRSSLFYTNFYGKEGKYFMRNNFVKYSNGTLRNYYLVVGTTSKGFWIVRVENFGGDGQVKEVCFLEEGGSLSCVTYDHSWGVFCGVFYGSFLADGNTLWMASLMIDSDSEGRSVRPSTIKPYHFYGMRSIGSNGVLKLTFSNKDKSIKVTPVITPEILDKYYKELERDMQKMRKD